MKSETLSDKIMPDGSIYRSPALDVEDVKEFIRLLKENFYGQWQEGHLHIEKYYNNCKVIDRLVGKKLK